MDAELGFPVAAAVAVTVMSYTIDGVSPEMEHVDTGQETASGGPPLRGEAVNTNAAQGPPDVGGMADTVAVVGPVGVTVIRVGALTSGVVNMISLPRGVCLPSADIPTSVAVYLQRGSY